MVGSTLGYKKGASEPFFQRANKHSANRTNYFNTLMPIPLTANLKAADIPQEALPYIMLANTKSGETVELVSATMCSFT